MRAEMPLISIEKCCLKFDWIVVCGLGLKLSADFVTRKRLLSLCCKCYLILKTAISCD